MAAPHPEAAPNGARRPWHRPQVGELPADEAAPQLAEGMRGDPKLAEAVREARQQFYAREIQRFFQARRQGRSAWVSREELAERKDRLFLIKRSIIDNVAEHYRRNPHTDLAVAVLVIDSLYADNDQGCSTVSATRMAKLLSCDERSIRRCRDSLFKDALLDRETSRGFVSRHWPVINRFLLGADVHPTAWLDATSMPPGRRDHPRDDAAPDEQPRTADAGVPRTTDAGAIWRPRTDDARTPDS